MKKSGAVLKKPRECWVVTDGRAGIANQALGLAEAVARETEIVITKKTIAVAEPWRSLPRFLWGDPFSRLLHEQSLLRPPFPDLWIGCGRLATPFTIAAKKRAPETFTVQLQNPRARTGAFDLIIPPQHDNLHGDNVFAILGSPNRISPERLSQDGAALAPLVAHLPGPRVAVLIGGSNSAHKVTGNEAAHLAHMLEGLSQQGAGLLITASRRTPPEVIEALAGLIEKETVFYWDGEGRKGLANPYPGILAMADHVIVTEDSVNMAAEAGGAGKPVHIHAWRKNGRRSGAAKFVDFHAALEQRGVARPFEGRLDDWDYTPLNETHRAATALIARWNAA